MSSSSTRTERRLACAGLALAALLAACQPDRPGDLPPLTRVVHVDTPTASATSPPTRTSPPPSATPTPSATPLPPTSTPTVPPVIDLMAVGDLMLARSIGERLKTGTMDPLAAVLPVLGSADLLVGNLECALVEQGQPAPKAYVFGAPPAAAEVLGSAGFDVLSVANNHALDLGYAALAETQSLLDQQAIRTVGGGADLAQARAPVFIERSGLRVAFLAYVDVPVETRTGFDTRAWWAADSTPGIAWADVTHIQSDVRAARGQADVVVVLLHFGLEGRTEVTRQQKAQARAAVEAGAALVLGSHPHVLQGVEQYAGGLIAYSLGNFVFDGYDGPENETAIFTARLTAAGVEAYNWVPVLVEAGLPRLARPEEAATILSRVAPLD